MNRAIKWIKRPKPVDWLRLAIRLLPHAAIVIAGMLIVFFAIDRVNKPMGFMTNEFHKRLTFALALLSIYLAVQSIAAQRRRERADYRKRLREAQQTQRKRQTPAAAPDRRADRPSASPNTQRRTS